MRILGIDFTSTPRRGKPLACAVARLGDGGLRVERVEGLPDFARLGVLLARPGPWVAGLDFPFALARATVADLGWPTRWPDCVTLADGLGRDDWRQRLDRLRAARPAGAKYRYRRCDALAGGCSPEKLVNPPVALMFHVGAPLLLASGAHIPGLRAAEGERVILETYPALLARAVTAAAYKSDTRALQTPARAAARACIVAALRDEAQTRYGLRVSAPDALWQHAQVDASGDTLDAVICAVLAAWAAVRPGYGLPADVDPLEGWIVGAGDAAFARAVRAPRSGRAAFAPAAAVPCAASSLAPAG